MHVLSAKMREFGHRAFSKGRVSDPNDANATILELDELWSFVLKR